MTTGIKLSLEMNSLTLAKPLVMLTLGLNTTDRLVLLLGKQ